MTLRTFVASLLFIFALAGCMAPAPIPVPVPPDPTPIPIPVPSAHVVTAAEYEGVVVGATSEVDLLAQFGSPARRSPLSEPGVVALIYPAKRPDGSDAIAEFWVKAGVVSNKNRL